MAWKRCLESEGSLKGNFAPIQRQRNLEPCTFYGTIPVELHGGQYVRNGGNPTFGDDLTGRVHMFDGDGMLAGVLFRTTELGKIEPCFVNKYILTDVYVATKSMPFARSPILPSMAALINPLTSTLSTLSTLYQLCRFLILILWSHLNGHGAPVRKISVANTAIVYHDKRTLATCQTGPPMRVQLPSLETVEWYNGSSTNYGDTTAGSGKDLLGRNGLLGFLKDWTTAHPYIDRITGDFISFQSSFLPPYVWYSVIPGGGEKSQHSGLNAAISGISSPKLMHDFGVSLSHTVILDLPMSLDPINILRGRPIVHYDKNSPSRFGILPRHDPALIRWFETVACFIFHTAGTWDEVTKSARDGEVEAVNMVACRYTGADMLYSMASMHTGSIPSSKRQAGDSRLYYYRFLLSDHTQNHITHQWALSAIPFEMPVVSPSTTKPKFVYGCSSKNKMYGSITGEPMKIDCLVKMDIETLIRSGIEKRTKEVDGCVDERLIGEILQSEDTEDCIKVFQAPEGWCAQEPCFIPRNHAQSEDDGYILTVMFDEAQLDKEGRALEDSRSELWIIEALDMRTVLARIFLPQRVPYGFHGNWFTREQIKMQRPYKSLRKHQWPNL